MVAGPGTAWPVEPTRRVGPFLLGMGVNEALATIQKMRLDKAEFNFDERRVFDTDMCLRLPSLGIQLCFDGFQQDLRLIVVCFQQQPAFGSSGTGSEPTMLPSLSYGGRIFVGAQHPEVNFREVYTMFGPTWIGDFQSGSRSAYTLRYPGLAFEFPLPEDMVDTLAARCEHPIEIPDTPMASRMWVYCAASTSFQNPVSAREEHDVAVVRPAGVELRGRRLRFGSMPQDIFSDFGPPEQVCTKDNDAVKIHSAATENTGPADYFYNYFHLGVDVLFDGRSHMMKKVILHTNHPTHELFSQYARCFFQVPIAPSDAGRMPDASVGALSQAMDIVTLEPPMEEMTLEIDPPELGTCARASCSSSQVSNSDEPAGRDTRTEAEVDGKPEHETAKSRPEVSIDPLHSTAQSPILAKLCELGPAGIRDSPCWDLPPASPLEKAQQNSAHSAQPTAAGRFGQDHSSFADRACHVDLKWAWSDIERVLTKSTGCSCAKPLVMNQGGHTPFGSTFFYAFPGLVFEVMQNGFVASLTVFQCDRA